MEDKFPKMKRDIKARWIKALRSRRYRQIPGKLRDKTNGRCCLGVYCGVVDPKGWSGVKHRATSDIPCIETLSLGRLQESVAYELAWMNDGVADDEHCYTFAEIATWIEKNL